MKSLLITAFIILGHMLLPYLMLSATPVEIPGHIVYLSPLPGSQNHNPESGISIRFKDGADLTLPHHQLIAVTASESGMVEGIIKTNYEEGVLIFQPSKAFHLGETIQVVVFPGDAKREYTYHFSIRTQMPANAYATPYEKELSKYATAGRLHKNRDNNLPEDFPELQVTDNSDPSAGYYFLGIGASTGTKETYLTILDTTAFPVYFKKIYNAGADFKLQPNGYLTYYTGAGNVFYELDSAYRTRRIMSAANGYTMDMHDLIVLENNDYYLLAQDPQIIDMSQLVPGGKVNANVLGYIIQKRASTGELLFQWRSLDHIPVLDADPEFVNFTARNIDYIHSNAIDIDNDGHLLLSSRHLNEITKINSTSGDIIWRWGGSQNEFTFIDDPRGFKGQHSIRSHSNGKYTLFNNGNHIMPRYSAGHEYQLNVNEMSATLTHEYTTGNPAVFSWAMGHFQRMQNGRTIIGWSSNPDNVTLTEYNSQGDKVFELENLDGTYSYRAFKFNWQTNAMLFDQYMLYFNQNISIGDSAVKSLTVTNNLNTTLSIDHVHFNLDVFSLLTPLPVEILPGQSAEFTVQFKPTAQHAFIDVMTLYHQEDDLRIGKQIKVSGGGFIPVGTEELSNKELKIYPNPASGSFFIESDATAGKAEIFDLCGNRIKNLHLSGNKTAITLPPGLYVVRIKGRNERVVVL